RAAGTQWAAVEWHGPSGRHIPGGILSTNGNGTIRRADRGRAAPPRLHRGQASLLCLRARAGGQSASATTEHASPAWRTVNSVGSGRLPLDILDFEQPRRVAAEDGAALRHR